MTEITDEFMRDMLTRARPYSLVILTATPRYYEPDVRPLIWEHGRRNFALRAAGTLAVVCPVDDDSEVCGIAIFALSPDDTRAVMAEDPAVQAGIFTVQVHPCRGFPGDRLPD